MALRTKISSIHNQTEKMDLAADGIFISGAVLTTGDIAVLLTTTGIVNNTGLEEIARIIGNSVL